MLTLLLEITILALLVAANGYLAGSEIAVVAARRARLRRRAAEGDRGSARALQLLDSPNRFLSTVQIGITAIAVVGGAFGGTRLAATLAQGLAAAGMPEVAAREVAIVVVVIVITYVMLVAGELVPKRLALADPERRAARVARPMLRLSVLATPFVNLLSASTDFVLGLLPRRPPADAETTEDDIRALIAHATETGVLEATEQQIVDRLFRLSDKNVEMLMTPRERIVWLDTGADAAAWRERMGEVRHSRYIVADGDLERYVGYVSAQDLLRRQLAGERLDLAPVIRQPHVVPGWTPAFRLLELFQWSGDHIALVEGASGQVAGLITLNDVLEGIVGDIPEAFEVPVPGVVLREDGSLLVDGLLPHRELLETLELAARDEERFPTVHAFVVARLGSEPRPAAAFPWRGYRVEIVDMDGSRVDKILVSQMQEEPPW
jgi:putative hemolysin